jgi:DNA-binding NtrC family response regulator
VTVQTKERILVVNDGATIRSALIERLRADGYAVEAAVSGARALAKLADLAPHLVLVDLERSDVDSLGLVEKIQEHDAEIAVLVLVPAGAVDTAVAALRAGASAYLTKPINADELSLVAAREIARQRLRAEVGQLHARLAERHRFENLIGGSAPMQAVFRTMARAAPGRASVLLTGEAGTGKALIAAAIHERSPRARAPFIRVFGAGLDETALERALFGHERGAFAGALSRRDGCLCQADGGTIFLNEVGEISPALQAQLLRFLQQHQFERVGGDDRLTADVRVIASTARDLRRLVDEGKFLPGLFGELNLIPIELPALRDRSADVPLLAMHFLHKYAGVSGKTISGFTEDALQRLVGYPWPGNVRELENVIERAVVLCLGPQITGADLPPNLQVAPTGSGIQIPGSTLDAIERYAITRTLEATGGSTSQAAEILGISIRKVQYKLHEYQSAPGSEREALALNVKEN